MTTPEEILQSRLAAEGLIPMAAAALLVPPARLGRARSARTLVRWHLAGTSAGVTLEAARGPGGHWQTSAAAVARFLAAVAAARCRPRVPTAAEGQADAAYRAAGVARLRQLRDADRARRAAARGPAL